MLANSHDHFWKMDTNVSSDENTCSKRDDDDCVSSTPPSPRTLQFEEERETIILLDSSGWSNADILIRILENAEYNVREFSVECPSLSTAGTSATICKNKMSLTPKRLGTKAFKGAAAFIYCGLPKALQIRDSELTIQEAPSEIGRASCRERV